MSEQDDIAAISRIKKTHENIVVIAGFIMGLTLSIYFFTFGMLMDKAATGMLYFQLITTVLFIFGLIFIKRLGFFITKLLLGQRKRYKRFFARLSAKDLAKEPEALLAEFNRA